MEIYIRHYLPYSTPEVEELKRKSISYLGGDIYTFNIEDSIHYNTIQSGDYSIYDEYVKKTGQELDGHTISMFRKLIGEFDISKMDSIKIKWDNSLKYYMIWDGCHRSSILKSMGMDITPYIEIIK